MAIHLVVGVRAVGKSSACIKVVSKLTGLIHLSYSDLLLTALQRLTNQVIDRESLPQFLLEDKISKRAHHAAHESLASERLEIILEYSGLCIDHGGWARISGRHVFQDLEVLSVNLCFAHVQKIIDRRSQDTKARREAVLADQLAYQQCMIESWVSAFAVSRQVPFSVIDCSQEVDRVAEMLHYSICLARHERERTAHGQQNQH